jgi:predicted dehydrogenase
MSMTSDGRVRVGVIGLGFMGATHIAAFQSANAEGFPCELTAVCDPKTHRRRGELGDVAGNLKTGADASKRAFDPEKVAGYERAADLIADPNVDLVSICTRTDTHVDLCIAALEHGKHVLVEKPVALSAEQIERVIEAERKSGRICMPAMCLRFWPGWDFLRKCVADGSLGKCHSASFQRLAATPGWSDFFADPLRSGGALMDLHIHDADFIYWLFGKPRSVTSAGRLGSGGAVDHVTTLYHFHDDRAPRHVVAEGGWDHAATFAYRMRFVVVFEEGTLDFDLTRDPPLLICRNDRAEPFPMPATNGYDGEIRAILTAITNGDRADIPSLADAAAVTRILSAEAESVRTGKSAKIS